MKVTNRVVFLLVGALLAAACSSLPPARSDLEILWDTWGVPHIFAADDESLYYGLGWAQMHNNPEILLRLYGQARGRAAEYWGAEYVKSDTQVHQLRIIERAQSWIELQDPAFLKLLQAFVAGVNDFAARHPEQVPDEHNLVLPVTVADLFAHQQRAGVLPFAFASLQSTTAEWQSRASNAWAIAPSRTVNGNAMLVANPHIPWGELGHGGLFRVMEIQARTPENDFYGGMQIALPGVGGGFNDHMGYSGTVNTLDSVDVYELTLDEIGYRWDGGSLPFERFDRVIRVRNDDDSMEERSIAVKWSVHGPVMAERNGKALAVRLADYRQSHQLEQLWRMGRSRSLDEFRSVVSQLQMPKSNLLYADRHGEIYYVANGMIPRRETGDSAFWRGIVPGDTAATLWDDTLSFDELPQIANPGSGWLQNANDPPWSATVPFRIQPKDYPLALSSSRIGLRAQRSIEMITAQEVLTFADVERFKLSTRLLLADRVFEDLEQAVGRHGSSLAREALVVLQSWDRNTDNDSRGAVLFVAWAEHAGFGSDEASGSLYRVDWQPDRPLNTPYGLKDHESAAAALDAAAQRVLDTHGRLDVAYGEVYRLQWNNDIDLPANGAPGSLGSFRVTNFLPTEDNQYRAFAGDSLVFIVEFSDPVRAHATVSYGNASDSGSSHNGDQLELYSNKELRPVWRTREDIEANLAKRELLVYPG